jgi:hypothetical protein
MNGIRLALNRGCTDSMRHPDVDICCTEARHRVRYLRPYGLGSGYELYRSESDGHHQPPVNATDVSREAVPDDSTARTW